MVKLRNPGEASSHSVKPDRGLVLEKLSLERIVEASIPPLGSSRGVRYSLSGGDRPPPIAQLVRGLRQLSDWPRLAGAFLFRSRRGLSLPVTTLGV